MNRTRLSINDTLVAAGNITGDVLYEWEYYYDYLDPVIVDASKLKYNKYSIVIILWISLVAFVGFLFLTLNLMSVTGSMPKRRRLRRNETYRESTA
ncbi:melanocortin-2 receptor accessory protein [Oryzias latipes]|uniref:Melanocortin 2 receptor accessory protein n=1 Tax=Oryzias latipes TaxID=8090 RepID=A0A3B3IME5_ORYLA